MSVLRCCFLCVSASFLLLCPPIALVFLYLLVYLSPLCLFLCFFFCVGHFAFLCNPSSYDEPTPLLLYVISGSCSACSLCLLVVCLCISVARVSCSDSMQVPFSDACLLLLCMSVAIRSFLCLCLCPCVTSVTSLSVVVL